jgi:thiol-disulfide isomerase/thioredoxin
MIILDEKNFDNEVLSARRVLVYFYQESGCRFCDMMKPFIKEHSENKDLGFEIAKYAIQINPDEITTRFNLQQTVPAFFAFEDGKLVGEYRGALNFNQIPLVFTPEKLPFRPTPLVKLSLGQLLNEEALLIDRIAPIREQLGKVQAEISKRRKLAEGKLGACCGGCASGGSCEGGSCASHA